MKITKRHAFIFAGLSAVSFFITIGGMLAMYELGLTASGIMLPRSIFFFLLMFSFLMVAAIVSWMIAEQRHMAN